MFEVLLAMENTALRELIDWYKADPEAVYNTWLSAARSG